MELIRSGKIFEVGKLPTERSLAERLDVSRRYIRQALDALEGEGLIRANKGTVRSLASRLTR